LAISDFGGEKHSSQKNEIPELRMDDVSVRTHLTKTRRHGHRLMTDNPQFAWPAVRLHRETHRRVNRPNTLSLQGCDDTAGNLVNPVAGVMKFEVSERAALRIGSRFIRQTKLSSVRVNGKKRKISSR
jgi:hypothetical protein